MGLRARAHPWAVGWKWGVGGGGRDELMGGLTKRTVRTEGNGLETNASFDNDNDNDNLYKSYNYTLNE